MYKRHPTNYLRGVFSYALLRYKLCIRPGNETSCTCIGVKHVIDRIIEAKRSMFFLWNIRQLNQLAYMFCFLFLKHNILPVPLRICLLLSASGSAYKGCFWLFRQCGVLPYMPERFA